MNKKIVHNYNLDLKEVEKYLINDLWKNEHKKYTKIAEKIKKELEKKELIKQLNKFQGIFFLMGTITIKDKKDKEKYMAFFQSHPYLGQNINCLNVIGEMYFMILQENFIGQNWSTIEEFKSSKKMLDKEDVRKGIIDYIIKLKPFPDYNIIECSEAESNFLNEFYSHIISSDGNKYICPYDGVEFNEPSKDYLDIKFCSERCKNNYSLLQYTVNNNKKNLYYIMYSFNKRDLVKFKVGKGNYLNEIRRQDNSGSIMPIFPKICMYCGNENLHDNEILEQRYYQAEFLQDEQKNRSILRGLSSIAGNFSFSLKVLVDSVRLTKGAVQLMTPLKESPPISKQEMIADIQKKLLRLTRTYWDYYLCQFCREHIKISKFLKFLAFEVAIDKILVEKILGKNSNKLIKKLDNPDFGFLAFEWKKSFDGLSKIDINNIVPLNPIVGDGNDFLKIVSKDKLFIWELIKLNYERINEKDIISSLVSFLSIDKSNAIEWIEKPDFM